MKMLAFLLLALLQNANAAGGITNVYLKPDVVARDSDIYLSFDLQNRSRNDIKTYKSNLPWGSLYSTILIACLASRDHTELQPKYYFDDPGPEFYVIKKDSTASGKINLSKIFPALKESLKNDDVLIFWSFVLRGVAGDTSDRFGGMVVIPRNLDDEQ